MNKNLAIAIGYGVAHGIFAGISWNIQGLTGVWFWGFLYGVLFLGYVYLLWRAIYQKVAQ